MTRPRNMFWLGLFGLLLAPNLAHGIEYLLAMSADNAGAANTSTIRSIALDNTYAITNQKELLSGYTGAISGLATISNSLYVANTSKYANGYTISSDGAGNLNTSALGGFTTINSGSGTGGSNLGNVKGISVNSTNLVAAISSTSNVALYDPATGSAGSPASFAGAASQWKSVLAPNGNYYVISNTSIGVYNSSGTPQGTLSLPFTPTNLRDIVFSDSSTLFLTDYASSGGVYKLSLSNPTTSAGVNGFGTSGFVSYSNAFGLALSADASQIYVSRYFSSSNTNRSEIDRLSTSAGAKNTVIASTNNPYAYQYLAVSVIVPEPSSVILGGISAAGMILLARYRKRV